MAMADIPHIDKMISNVEAKKDDIYSTFKINSQIQSIQQVNLEIEQFRDFNAKKAHVKGRLSLYLRHTRDTSDKITEKCMK
ncbi:MAG: hypothetical protein R2741_00175 [Methanolobus sp.]